MRILVVGNPVSGGGRTGRRIAGLVGELERRGHEVESFLTSRAGDASERASRVVEGTDRLVVVGGDGTLNEVLNGLQDPGAVPLVQLATGTANILARELGLPRSPAAVAALAERGSIRRIDMGRIAGRRFLMVASAGFDALVTRDLHEHRTGALGFRGYVRPILRALRSYRPPRIEVEVDTERPVEGSLVIVSNTRNYGGLFTVADLARCDSGRLDVCVLHRAGWAGLLRAAFYGLTGGLSGRRGVTYLTGSRVSLRSAEEVPVEIDGDYFGTTPVQIELEPRRVPVVVPAGEPGR